MMDVRLAWFVPPRSLQGVFVGTSTMQSSVAWSSFPSKTCLPWIGSCGVVGLKTVALSPWNRTARSPLQSLFADRSGVLISSCLSACLPMVGRCCNASSSVADAVMILLSATCALVASAGDTSW